MTTQPTPDQSPVPDYLTMLRLDGTNAVVLGGGNGIGRQTVHALTQAGASVACVDIDPQVADAVAEETGAIPLTGDITVRADVEDIFSTARNRLGPINCVVDIVGYAHLGPLTELDDATWRHQFDVVLNHAFLAMQIGGKAVADAGGGSLIFVGSISGAANLPGQVAYGSAKAALRHMVAGMGKELGPLGVRVNAVAPGFVKTPRLGARLGEEKFRQIGDIVVPLGKAATPSEIAGPILFLASNLASHITGVTLLTDGGMHGKIHLPDLW
jgi:NAD(P)-dependent dehydrogenase (short-subunit alcohol dehydrogenase family)